MYVHHFVSIISGCISVLCFFPASYRCSSFSISSFYFVCVTNLTLLEEKIAIEVSVKKEVKFISPDEFVKKKKINANILLWKLNI